MSTTLNGCEFVPHDEPVVLTERQKLVNATPIEKRRLLPSAHRVISIDKNGSGGGYPIVVFRVHEDGSREASHLAKGVIVHGDSWMIEMEEKNFYCGSERTNNVAVETFAAITLLD